MLEWYESELSLKKNWNTKRADFEEDILREYDSKQEQTRYQLR